LIVFESGYGEEHAIAMLPKPSKWSPKIFCFLDLPVVVQSVFVTLFVGVVGDLREIFFLMFCWKSV